MATEPQKPAPEIMPPVPEITPRPNLSEMPQDKDTPRKEAPERGSIETS